MGFFYSFTETLLQSTWQGALCAAIYVLSNVLNRSALPRQNRNFLLALLAAQSVITIATFVYFIGGLAAAHHNLYDFLLLPGRASRYYPPVFFLYVTLFLLRVWKTVRGRHLIGKYYKIGLTRPSPALRVFTDIRALQLGIKRRVQLRYSKNIDAPITFGRLKPFILVPFTLINQISPAAAEAIILHELAHIMNRDYLLNRFLVAVETLYFFNPFVLFMTLQVRLEREKSCDLEVINFGYSPLLYAETLLATARHSITHQNFQLSIIGVRSRLAQRIAYITAVSIAPNSRRRTPALQVIMVSFFILSALFFLPGNQRQTTPVNTREPESFASAGIELPRSIGLPESKVDETNRRAESQIRKRAVKKTVIRTNPATATNDKNYAVSVNYTPAPDSVKEFIYCVETRDGMMTQSFKLRLVSGKWVPEPQWMLLETKPGDSSQMQNGIDSGKLQDQLPQ